MDKEEFIELCSSSGYCTKAVARKYVETNPKDFYDDADFIEAYRFKNQWNGKHTKGQKGITGGFTTAYNHIKGNSSRDQDWV